MTASLEPVVASPQTPSRVRRSLAPWIALSALLAGLLGWALAVGQDTVGQPAFNGGQFTPAPELPALSLTRADGGAFTTADTRGRLSLFFFGYTTCPDVCPMTLAQMVQVRRQLGPQAARVDVYFITVDPERDTPQRLASYLTAFDPAIVGLTGTAEQLAQARTAFGAAAERREVPGSQLGYLMDHSATIYLIDRDSHLRLVYPPTATPSEIAADLARLLR